MGMGMQLQRVSDYTVLNVLKLQQTSCLWFKCSSSEKKIVSSNFIGKSKNIKSSCGMKVFLFNFHALAVCFQQQKRLYPYPDRAARLFPIQTLSQSSFYQQNCTVVTLEGRQYSFFMDMLGIPNFVNVEHQSHKTKPLNEGGIILLRLL